MTTEQKKLQGTWQLVEITTTGPNGTTNRNPQPGLLLFSGSHYSRAQVTGGSPRKDIADVAKATADELREMLRFAANAGTFEAKGGELIFHPSVALGTYVMASGAAPLISSYKLEGDILTTTQKSGPRPIPNPQTVKYRRIE